MVHNSDTEVVELVLARSTRLCMTSLLRLLITCGWFVEDNASAETRESADAVDPVRSAGQQAGRALR